ncbi:type II secretion system protein GspM [Thalassolituus sp.]|uniref:type II secretion system protein GspM n=1 Tax=Thalassolituus sp. TaxID=2030822 RepID=UPI003516D8CE
MNALTKLWGELQADPRVQQAIDWYQKKPPVEQSVIRALVAFVAVGLIYLIFIAPLVEEHRQLTSSLQKKTAFYELMAENGAQFAGSGSGASGNKPLLSVVSQEARKAGIALTRYEQDGAALRVWVDDASFDDAMRWIESLARRQGVVATQANIDRDAQPGRADIRITFSQ